MHAVALGRPRPCSAISKPNATFRVASCEQPRSPNRRDTACAQRAVDQGGS